MEKQKAIDIILGIFTGTGVIYVFELLREGIVFIFEDSIKLNPTLFGIFWFFEIVFALIVGIYLWRIIKISKYFSYSFLVVIVIRVLTKLFFFVKTLIKLYF